MPFASAGQPPPPSSSNQRLWAVLLVLDAFFVITFGGTLAMKVYQHWQPPAAATAPETRSTRAPRKASETPGPNVSAPDKEAAPAVASAPVTLPSAPPVPVPQPPKPSLLYDAPGHSAAAPQTNASATPPAKAKAVPIEFSFKSSGARSVELAGAFIVHGGKKAMISHPDGTWTLTLYLTPNAYRYWFIVNGKKIADPQNPKTNRGASVVNVTP